MQAIILAGGFGTRLRSVIADVPKPMAPINGKPFLAYLIDYLKSQGVTKVILSVHYLREKIQDYFQECYEGLSIQYVLEDEPLGTGGAILNALQCIDSDEPLFVLNGDTFLRMDYKKMLAQHHKNSPNISMALRKIADCSRYGVVHVDAGCVTAFQDQGEDKPGLINAGVYLLTKKLFAKFAAPKQFSFERDFLFPQIAQIHPEAFVVEDYFIDIGVPEDYERAALDFVNF